ncbi:hypothetical protein QFC19_003729 [Naganishia cerealis]|uniref:Uncharacterized protein n=1 Tax=Naganishia cerealis TaxID=610337 RepID=A0ACC2VZN1_9TREE|nr:hypothetical protein QFC19_003729 [Naganishia cerealis]
MLSFTSHSMPPKTPSSQPGGPKQTSLLGFFTKPTTTPTTNRQRPPLTPASATVNSSGRGSGSRAAAATPASTSSEAVEKRRRAILAASEGSPTASVSKNLPNEAINGAKGCAVLGIVDARKEIRGELNKQDRKPESDATSGSSPLSAIEVLNEDEDETTVVGVEARENKVDQQVDRDGEGGRNTTNGLQLSVQDTQVQDGELGKEETMEDEDDEQPVRLSKRTSKRKMTYIETDDDEASSDSDIDERKSAQRPSTSTSGRKKPRVLADEDDFEFDDGGMDDEELDIMMLEYEEPSSPDKSVALSLAETDEDEIETTKKSSKAATSKSGKSNSSSRTMTRKPSSSIPQRPPPRPLTASGSGARMNGSGSLGAGGFMTQAERAKIDAKEKKAAEQDCFEFLRQLKDGKFYELYEKDAEIGHNEFDLKLTDRVKMKMVGVPEQSFDYWCAKFLAAGYKVGKVEQAETAIGMEMRTKAAAGKTKNKADSIVRRELAAVLTNGTVVDEAFLSGDEACHCIAIKVSALFSISARFCLWDLTDGPSSLAMVQQEGQSDDGNATYGVCILDAATGRFELTAFEDDACRTKLETLFRQLRPRELVYSKGNLGVVTSRLLRNILPMNASWVSLKPETEFYNEDKTRQELTAFFDAKNVESDKEDVQMTDETQHGIPEAITSMLDKPLAIEALGGMMFYLRSLNMANDLLSQRSFNVYDPIRKGESLVLDGQTLSHLEILVNNEGGEEGTLLGLLQRCVTPFGKRLFRIWLTVPLQKIDAIGARQDAVQDLMNHPTFSERFHKIAKDIPDLERLISRIHAGRCKQSDFLKVMSAFKKLNAGFSQLASLAQSFDSTSVASLLRGAPDMTANLEQIQSMYELLDNVILPTPGASEECDEARVAVEEAEAALNDVLEGYKEQLNAQGAKDIYVIQVPAKIKAPTNWTKTGGTKAFNKYVTPKTQPLIREVQEARETKKTAFQGFYAELLHEFDKERDVWLKAVRILAELDCLLSLAKASADLDEPRCRPELVDSEEAFIDFKDLRHPALCLRSDFISNDVQLGNTVPRQTLLTGPNTAGKSTLCRMTSVAVIMAQLGALVPASEARISPIDKIQTRMGAYDNMFSNSSTFKVELDECAKILREGGPKSLVILDELGRGTSTYDGMAIAEAVLHHLSTATLPLGFFATHYGALTDDFQYHPNVRCMHMQTQVDDEKREVLCLYKLIEGRAESSYGTHVAHLAGVPDSVVTRAEQVSSEFFTDFKQKMAARRKSDLPVLAQADFNWLYKSATTPRSELSSTFLQQLALIKGAIGHYEH